MKTNVYVIYGGKSAEHEVSLITGFSVINALDKEKYNVYPVYISKEGHWCCLELQKSSIEDVKHLQKHSSTTVGSSMGRFLTEDFKEDEKSIIFPALHGTNGEDGTLQGFLELLEVPYVGNTVLASAIGIDKVVMKEIFSKYNIPQAKYIFFNYHHWANNPENICCRTEEIIGYPCFVKPAKMGSSVGISRCHSPIELKKAIDEALLYDQKIIVEEEILGREMQIAVIGNDEPQCSVVGEYIQVKSFMDYEAKYVDGQLIPVIPAVLTPHTRKKCWRMQVKYLNY
ncbi:D-alanine-D-alanine ligase [Alkaliphilus peptidifermentans DSM 18978]|uniref:D-alanine--D-alanine ligase n=1 Tax=Alkaliphilus peptidifermentans DSM 18978 TaxID=1120976 RepID=A0A1G5HAR1_9FIRM|nr:D-alanine--D-alanine ligase [Alkaliphilus peptidifermentans]SCY60579.1 D-alanine-D-alanine ligase [Alkaliphilus peptidifermentans DSM 18978]